LNKTEHINRYKQLFVFIQ